MPQIHAAAVQMKKGTLLGNRDTAAGGVGVIEAAALPVQRSPQVADRIIGDTRILGGKPVVLESLIDAADSRAVAGLTVGDAAVAPLLPHAELGGHRDHQGTPFQFHA